MLKVSFSSAIAVYLSFSIFLVFVLWIFYNYRRNGIFNETKYLQQCPFCTHVFFRNEAEQRDASISVKDTTDTGRNPGDLTLNKKRTTGGQLVFVCPQCHSYINLED